jgi:hypothetical protein
MLIAVYLMTGFGLAMVISWLGWRNLLFHMGAPLYGVAGGYGFHTLGVLKAPIGDISVVMAIVFYLITWLFWLDKNYNTK